MEWLDEKTRSGQESVMPRDFPEQAEPVASRRDNDTDVDKEETDVVYNEQEDEEGKENVDESDKKLRKDMATGHNTKSDKPKPLMMSNVESKMNMKIVLPSEKGKEKSLTEGRIAFEESPG